MLDKITWVVLFKTRGDHILLAIEMMNIRSKQLPALATYRKAMLRNWDAARLNKDTHTLVDAGCKSERFIGSLAFVPPWTSESINNGYIQSYLYSLIFSYW